MTEAYVPATGARTPPVERGETRIADRVVAKVASQAAREALRADGTSGGTLPDGSRPMPRATVTVREQSARVRVALELAYPSDIGAQCGAVRRQVALRVRELVGMDVPDVALDIERLHSAHQNGDTPGRVT
ncbi:Asp23/Gls24 family envelope stress response protein [Streptomyces iconiensis]|uniref:Asp23/Gls24 family envelope stress response protein n=1 Tax=Streptomyces iconiensis TaxID=1384038 RepID=A0ABT6ZVG1_9ACTN|nr:Asp23/Gls24 family envelope stress response protein [Streptomyces iconiensis]MDJ1133053.1 Asp23/Gls24 family envelope stress response protein [Streptomyces iconiensis]